MLDTAVETSVDTVAKAWARLMHPWLLKKKVDEWSYVAHRHPLYHHLRREVAEAVARGWKAEMILESLQQAAQLGCEVTNLRNVLRPVDKRQRNVLAGQEGLVHPTLFVNGKLRDKFTLGEVITYMTGTCETASYMSTEEVLDLIGLDITLFCIDIAKETKKVFHSPKGLLFLQEEAQTRKTSVMQARRGLSGLLSIYRETDCAH